MKDYMNRAKNIVFGPGPLPKKVNNLILQQVKQNILEIYHH